MGIESEGLSDLKVAAALVELKNLGSSGNSTSLLPAIKRQVKYSLAKPIYFELRKFSWRR